MQQVQKLGLSAFLRIALVNTQQAATLDFTSSIVLSVLIDPQRQGYQM